MMLSLFYFSFWVVMRGADSVRPSALHRGYVFIWLYTITWILLIGVTVLQDRFQIASGYPFVFLHAATFFCLLISLCELFALPTKRDFSSAVNAVVGTSREDAPPPSPRPESADAPQPSTAQENEPENADERTPLIAHGTSHDSNTRTTFATGYRRSLASIASEAPPQTAGASFAHEQTWSVGLPSWTWILQLLLIGPIPIWLFGQLGLFLTAAVSGTGTDGSSLLFPYIIVAVFSILGLLPLAPFIHRVPYHVPLFALAVLAGTMVYSLVAFPFSVNSQYKIFFQQNVDLETGRSSVSFDGLEDFVRPIVAAMPSAAGREVECKPASRREGLTSCRYDGGSVLPNIGSTSVDDSIPLSERFSGLVSVNVTRDEGGAKKATLEIDAVDTKACFVDFNKRITKFEVQGGSEWDPRFGKADDGVCQLRLWRRDWDKVWKVNIEWEDVAADAEAAPSVEEVGRVGDGELKVRDEGLEGEVACMWADANERGVIPALDEAMQYVPTWVTVTKLAEGLVVGKKRFEV